MSTFPIHFDTCCVCTLERNDEAHFLVRIHGAWFQSSPCTLEPVKPTPKRQRIPLIAIGPDGTAEHFPSTLAAERAGHDRRRIWPCRKDIRRTHHGRHWQEAA